MYKGEDIESGKSIYQGNYLKGTPKVAKHKEILDLIQNVWSKNLTSLKQMELCVKLKLNLTQRMTPNKV